MTTTASAGVEPTYGIGAVSRLTGIPLDTLRVWERRYGLVQPTRTADNKRHYTRTDVTRLSLIKQLVDKGHAISSVAQLSEQELHERLQIHLDSAFKSRPTGKPLRTLVYGDSLPFLIDEWKPELNFIDLIGNHRSFSGFEQAALSDNPELLLLELPVLHHERVVQLCELIPRTGAKKTVIIYAYGMNNLLDRLSSQGAILLRAPVSSLLLEQVCLSESGNQAAGTPVQFEEQVVEEEISPRRYTAENLTAIAKLSSNIKCECPHHLADLLFRLTAFEEYSRDCENRNAQDRMVHSRLYRATGKARAIMEEALDFLIQAEGIDFDD